MPEDHWTSMTREVKWKSHAKEKVYVARSRRTTFQGRDGIVEEMVA